MGRLGGLIDEMFYQQTAFRRRQKVEANGHHRLGAAQRLGRFRFPRRENIQDWQTVGRRQKVVERIQRGGVNPVEVFDDQDKGRLLRRRRHQLSQRIVDQLLQHVGVKQVEPGLDLLRCRFQTEQISQERPYLIPVEGQIVQQGCQLVQLRLNCVIGLNLGQTAHDSGHGPVWLRSGMRLAIALVQRYRSRVRLVQAMSKLLQQATFAHACLAAYEDDL